ncbi:MAG: hypothetical protein IKZ46_02255 [Victivallales bacterium]|nr:hypothetical protein [Victivallales bacterium]
MNYMDFDEWIWFCQFRSKNELVRMCDELRKEMGHTPQSLEGKSKDEVMTELDSLAEQRFTRAIHAPGMIIDMSVVGQLRDWWKEKKKDEKHGRQTD